MAGMGVALGPHGQGGLHHAGAGAVAALQVEVVGLNIQGEGPQPGGKQGQELRRRGQPLGQGQVEQHCPRRRHKARRRPQLGRLFPGGAQEDSSSPRAELRPGDPAQGQVGIGVR